MKRFLVSPLAVFLAGLAVQLWLWARSSYHWDQIHLYRLGLDFAIDGQISAVGKLMSGGGAIPGCLLQFVVGLPLEAWLDYRSPALVVVVFQAAAALVLWRLFERALGRRFAALYLAIYWLSPWRLYHSGFIWEPNYVLLPAAVHLWASWAQRDAPKRLASVVLGLVLLASPQLHLSGVVLAILTALLAWRGTVRPEPWGLAAGAALGSLTLAPTAVALVQGSLPSLAPAAMPGAGFVKVYPLLKALAYWVRLGSLDVGRRLRQSAYYPGNDPGPAGVGGEALIRGIEVMAMASVLLVLFAMVWYLRSSERGFFPTYVIGSAAALLLAAGLTSQTVQGWHTLIVLHAATIPVAAWCARGLDRPWPSWQGLALVLLLVLRLPVVAVLGLGHPMYQPPERPVPLEQLRPDHIEDPTLKPAVLPR